MPKDNRYVCMTYVCCVAGVVEDIVFSLGALKYVLGHVIDVVLSV